MNLISCFSTFNLHSNFTFTEKEAEENGENGEGDTNLPSSNSEASSTPQIQIPNENETPQSAEPASPSGMKHIKRAKVAGRAARTIPTFHQDASEKRAMVLS